MKPKEIEQIIEDTIYASAGVTIFCIGKAARKIRTQLLKESNNELHNK